MVGVGCKLVQFKVYCVLFVMLSTNIEKKSVISEEEQRPRKVGGKQ